MSEELSMSKKLVEYLRENYEIKLNNRGNVCLNDFTLAGNGLATRFYKSIIAPNKRNLKDILGEWIFLEDNELRGEITNILPTVKEEIEGMLRKKNLDEANEGVETPMSVQEYFEFIPAIDIESAKGDAVMINKKTSRADKLVVEKAWERIVGPQHVKLVSERPVAGRFCYDPLDLSPYKVDDETNMLIFNKYYPPEHRLERDREAVLDERFVAFLEGFFLGGSLDYAYNWLYHSTFKKMETYLVLVGAGGIGKNLLAEALKHVHGLRNFTKAPPSALNSKFNGHLRDCTLVYYDECKFSSDRNGDSVRKNRLKEWSNDYVPIEIKGVDAKTMDIFCSAIIATNNDSDVHLDQLDRKFSVMELTEERLEKRLGVEVADFLWQYIKRKDFPHAFLNYLEARINPDFNIYKEYRGPKFESLVLSSLLNWQNELLFNFVLSGDKEKYSFESIREEIPYFPNNVAKVNDFLVNFVYEGERLGKCVKVNGKNFVKVAEKFAPVDEEVNNLE